MSKPSDSPDRKDQIQRFHTIDLICTNFACPCQTLKKKLEQIVATPLPMDGPNP